MPAAQPGITIRPIRNLAGETEFAEVFFTGARTEADLVVGEVNGGWRVVMDALTTERAGTVVLPYQLKFEQEMKLLIELARRPTVLLDDPVMRDRLTQAWIGLQVLRYGNLRLVDAELKGRKMGPEASVNKLYWANWHQRFGELMMSVAGPQGLLVGDDYELDLFQYSFLNSRAETIYGGTNEVQRTILGERVLGLPRDPPLVG